MGVWVDVGIWSAPCKHTCACMHACTHMHVKHDKHGCLHGGGHLQLLFMYILVLCMVYACVNVHEYGGM